jgi:hypothetical protein
VDDLGRRAGHHHGGTKLMAEAIHDTEAERAAVIFYGTTFLSSRCC